MIMANSHLHTPNVNMQTPREMVFTSDNLDLFGSATYTPFGMGINTFAGIHCVTNVALIKVDICISFFHIFIVLIGYLCHLGTH